MDFFRSHPQPPSRRPKRDDPDDVAEAEERQSADIFTLPNRLDPDHPAPNRPTSWAAEHSAVLASNVPFKDAFRIFEPTAAYNETLGLEGQYLNTLDGDLTAGLERYFPTHAFRLRVSHRRLAGQIKQLRAEYDEYNRLPGKTPEMIERQRRLGKRLIVLEQQEMRVNNQLASTLVFGRFSLILFERGEQLKALSVRFFRYVQVQVARLIRGEEYVAVALANEELNHLYKVMSARLNDPHASPAELGRILNLYDRLAAQASHNSGKIRGKQPE